MEVDQSETGLEKRQSLSDYQHEFMKALTSETQVFNSTLKQLCQLMTNQTHASVMQDFILTVMREVETPFVIVQPGKSSTVADALKAIPDEKTRQLAKSF